MKADDSGTQTKEKVTHHTHGDQKPTPPVESLSSDCKRQKGPSKKKTRSNVAKGKPLRQGLQASRSGEISETVAKTNENVDTLSSDKDHSKKTEMFPSNSDVKRLIVEDIKRRDDNFATPRRKLAEAELPIVDGDIQS